MATKIRFARHGSKKKPFYKLVVTDSRSPRNGRFIERIGSYNPMLAKDNAERFTFNSDKIEKWLSTGAIPSEKVAILLFNKGVKQVEKYLPPAFPKTEEARQKILDKKAAEKAKIEADAKAKDEAEAKEKADAEAQANADSENTEVAKTETAEEVKA